MVGKPEVTPIPGYSDSSPEIGLWQGVMSASSRDNGPDLTFTHERKESGGGGGEPVLQESSHDSFLCAQFFGAAACAAFCPKRIASCASGESWSSMETKTPFVQPKPITFIE